MRARIAVILLCFGNNLVAEPLPDPLTLEDALSLASELHPVLEMASAEVDAARAELDSASASYGTHVTLEGRLRAVEPHHRSEDSSGNDSRIALNITKRLYDFGRTESAIKSAESSLSGSEWRYLSARQRQHIEVMQRFFNVILADLEYARDNEAMAMSYVRFDRAQDRNELKQLSDIELLEIESEYQKARHARYLSESRQRAARSRLALALNRPDDLPSNLVMPRPPDMQQELEDLQKLTADVLQNNPRLIALRVDLQAASAAVQEARKRYGPELLGEITAQANNRFSGSAHPFAAGVILQVPILSGGEEDAAIAAARAVERRQRASLRQAELDMRQLVLDTWLELDALRIRIQELDVLDDYRELYLDRSRALYDMEVLSDLGDSMVQTSVVRQLKAQAWFDWMLARARLEALQGRLFTRPEEIEAS